MKKAMCLAATLVGLSLSAMAQLDVSVTSLGRGIRDHKEAILHVQNNSGKTITAFDIELRLKRVDGTIDTNETAGVNFAKPGSGAIKPGGSYDLNVGFDGDIIEVTPGKVKAVVYSDQTATGDIDSINSFAKVRNQFALKMAQEAAAKPSAELTKSAQDAAAYAKIRRVQ